MNNTNKFLIYFIVTTFILYFGPGRYISRIPGFSEQLPIVETRQGLARGEYWTSNKGRSFAVFRSIPFAKQPVGRRRFKLPEPLGAEDRWNKVRDFNYDVACAQNSFLSGMVKGREDCLVVNVYSPDISPSANLPVLVFIHGGGFLIGDPGSTLHGPHVLMDQDVVLVTVRYRLGVLGFLNLENDNIQGNQGLWDQRQALVWVKQNIKYFGGDPNLVTIAGNSAGAMSVNFHLISPQSAGLFHRAILHSGNVLSPYTTPVRKPEEYARKLAESLGCTDETYMIPCLQDMPVKSLLQKTGMFDFCSVRGDIGLHYPFPWKPSPDSYADRSFLPADPAQLVEQGDVAKVPILIGFNEDEGLLYSTRFIKDPEFEKEFVDNLDVCLPASLLGLEEQLISKSMTTKAFSIMNKYSAVKDKRVNLTNFSEMMGDSVFNLPSHSLTEQLAAKNFKVYRYIFSHVGSHSLADILSKPVPMFILDIFKDILRMFESERMGACHGDELFYLFSGIPLINLLQTKEDRDVSDYMAKFWVNFARTGNPNEDGAEDWRHVSKMEDWSYWIVNSQPHSENRLDLKKRFSRWKSL